MGKNIVKTKRPELTGLEGAVMSVVWDLGECGSREVIGAFRARTRRPLADTTIRTVLANLRKKGYVVPVPTIERGMRLRPAVERSGVARRSLRQLIARFFGGSPSQAMAYLIQNETIPDEEIENLRRMIQAIRKARKLK